MEIWDHLSLPQQETIARDLIESIDPNYFARNPQELSGLVESLPGCDFGKVQHVTGSLRRIVSYSDPWLPQHEYPLLVVLYMEQLNKP